MMKMEKKIQLFRDTKKLFDENSIDFFPLYGTLLGFARDKQLIPWDEDIDLGAWYWEYDKIIQLKNEFEKIGYKMTYKNRRYLHINIIIDDPDNLKLKVPYHIGIDFWARDRNKVVLMKFFDNNIFNRTFRGVRDLLTSTSRKGKKISIYAYNWFSRCFHALLLFVQKKVVLPYSWFKEKDTILVYDFNVTVPSHSQQYLELTYGTNWRTPDTNWSREKWSRVDKTKIKYTIIDKNVKDLWIKRGDVSIT